MPLENMSAADEQRKVSLERTEELKQRIVPYLADVENIPTGETQEARYAEKRDHILSYLGASLEDWENWRWQMQNRVSDSHTLASLLHRPSGHSDDRDPFFFAQWMQQIAQVGSVYRWAVSPYYLSLMDWNDPGDPIALQSLPSLPEISDDLGEEDPMGEAFTSPAPCITRRYPDRLIINVTNICGMYCRHCQRRRNIGEEDVHHSLTDMAAALEYIRGNSEIRDVLITGGDALMHSDKTLEWLLSELHGIKHVEIKRLGTRAPVTLPQRVTPELADILAKYPPIYINTQFNHPKEVTAEAKRAVDRLIAAGVVMGNQSVLLKGVNTDPHIMKKLNQELLKIRVRPYYLFHAKNVKGTAHFVPSIQDGLNIMRELRGYTSGLAVPTYIINAPNGGGKTPLLPQYLLSLDDEKAVLRTWEDKVVYYHNHS